MPRGSLNPRVLVAEDDAELRGLLVQGLRRAGFDVAASATAAEFMSKVEDFGPDVLVIDIGLPDADGRDVCQALRAQGSTLPVLFLTARDARVDRLTGFALGGDDYVTKPFDFDELVARLQALLKRAGQRPTVQAGALRLDPVSHTARCGDVSVSLTPTEFRLLAALAGRPGEAVRRTALRAAGWPDGAIVHDNTLDVNLARVRRKLASLPGAPGIKTVHGIGYMLQ